ncbi:helix-turn-helix domain-containing protein [bacterium]|nr:helix-turn-helix domain-containing protein [bacterium]MBU1875246.1 helix-turn-helix domain-containing protein [bacterium]
MELEHKVLEAMKKAGKPVKAGDIAEMINVDKAQVAKAIKTLKDQGKVESPKVCFYKPVE